MQRSYPAQRYKLKGVVTLDEYIRTDLLSTNSPFVAEGVWRRYIRAFFGAVTRTMERMLGTSFLVEVSERELSVFDKSTRTLLHECLAMGKIVEWECGVQNEFTQNQYVCKVVAGDLRSEDGALACRAGFLNGQGAAATVNGALVIALAEAIERIVTVEWPSRKLQFATIRELTRNQVPYSAVPYLDLNNVELESIPIGWMQGSDLFTDRRVLIPASMLYLFYGWHHLHEPEFNDVSTNGVAAHTTVKRALELALYESLERDALLMYWLSGLTPKKIEHSTIDDPFVQDALQRMRDHGFSVHILDCMTEYMIPVLITVAVDNQTGGVSVNAAAGIYVDEVLQKVCRDMLRWTSERQYTTPTVAFSDIVSMEQREALWCGGHMREHIEFLISGECISLQTYRSRFATVSHKETELEYLKKRFATIGSEAFYYVYEHPLAHRAGLRVVRAVVPDLLPIYFNESKKPLNNKRLYAFAKRMGFRDTEMTRDELNMIPHPFI